MNIIDNKQKGFAKFAVLDRAGNLTIDSITHIPDSISFALDLIAFEKVRVKSSVKKPVTLNNDGSTALSVTNISLSPVKKNVNVKTKYIALDATDFYWKLYNKRVDIEGTNNTAAKALN